MPHCSSRGWVAGGYFWRDLRMAQARKPTPAAAPTAGRAVFIVSLVAADPTLPAADEALDATLSTTPVDAGFGGAGASVAADVEPVRAGATPAASPVGGGRFIGGGPGAPPRPPAPRPLPAATPPPV